MLNPARSARTALLALLAAVSVPHAAIARDTAPQPLTLDRAISIALQHNLTYAASHDRVDSAVAQLQQTRAPELPSVGLQYQYQYVSNVAKLNTPIGQLPFSSVNATSVPLATVQYTLFDGGLTASRVSQAQAGLAAAEAGERQNRASVIADVSKAYYDLASAESMQDVANRAVALAQSAERNAERFLKQGQIPRADLLRAQAEVANERVKALQAQNAVHLLQVALDNVLGMPHDLIYRPTDPIDAPAPSFKLATLLASATQSRGDLAAARAAVVAAEDAVSAAKAGYAPHVSAMIADGNTQPAVTAGFHNQFTIGLNAVWSLFDNGYTAGAVAQARSGVALAQNGLEQLEDGIDLQVRQAFLNVNDANERVAAASSYVKLADENLRLASVRYRGGVGTALELQDAEVRDRAAHEELVLAQTALRKSIVELRFASGLL